MDARLLDILSAAGSFIVFLVLLVFLPGVINPGAAYIIAIVAFILVMSGAGYMVNEKIT